jgi:hypothetical protein
MSNVRTDRNTNSWTVPATAGIIGAGYLIAGILGGQTTFGITGFIVMAAFAAVLRRGARHSETVRGLMNHSDERINSIDLRATAVTAIAMIAFTLTAFCVEVARGHSGWPYYGIAAVGGVTYLLSVVVLRIRG